MALPKSGMRQAASPLQRALAIDRQAFEELVTAYQPRVFSMALRFTGQRADSEELTQDVFVQLHAVLDQIDDRIVGRGRPDAADDPSG